MDLNLARTFVTVVYSGSFVLAADRLCVSQTTVTARIKNLEEQLGTQLFVRSATGVTLTAAGERFIPHAQQLLATWQEALQAVPEPDRPAPLRLGAETSLWQPWFGRWLGVLSRHMPELLLRAEVGQSQWLLDLLEAGQLDALLSHQVRYRPGVQVQLLMEETLVQVCHAQQPQPHIHIDWGEDFRQQFELAFPGHQARFATSVGPVGLQLLLEQGGTGYFRSQVVAPWLQNGHLQRVEGAPEFSLPVYLLSSRNCSHPHLQAALEHAARLLPADTPQAATELT
ncbi:MAG: LysR family transcriptional regulator [Thiopseudomonas sp.]